MSDQFYRGRPEVEVADLQEAFRRTGMTKCELAHRLGWMRPNVDKVNRYLGFRPDSGSRGVRKEPRQRLSYEVALELADAMDVDPVDVGL
jgi:hypothetical protein